VRGLVAEGGLERMDGRGLDSVGDGLLGPAADEAVDEVLRTMLENSGESNGRLSKALGYSGQGSLTRAITRIADLLIGSNADEWRMYLDEDTSEADVREWLAEHRPGEGEALMEILGDAPALTKLDRLVTARWYLCPSLEFANHVDDSGNRAWVYYFARVRSGERAAQLGAYHGAEIPYVFGKHDDWLPTDELDRGLGETIADYWVSFATKGNPNGGGRPDWPRYSVDDPAALEIGDEIATAAHPGRSLCIPREAG